MDYIFNAELQDNGEGGFIASFPDVPEAMTEGKDKRETLLNAQEVLGQALRGRCADNEEFPIAKHQGGIPVSVGAWDALKLSVIEAFNAAGITKRELSVRLGKDDKEAQRILDPDYPTKTQTLEQALNALGQQVIVIVRPAVRQKAA